MAEISFASLSPSLLARKGGAKPAMRPQHAALETGDVGASLAGGDDVDEGGDPALVARPPADRDVDIERALYIGRGHRAGVVQHRHRLGELVASLQPDHVGDRRIGGQEVAELRDAAIVFEHLGDRFAAAGVGDGMGLLHGIGSYLDDLTITAVSDRGMMPDPGHYGDLLEDSFDTLAAAAGA